MQTFLLTSALPFESHKLPQNESKNQTTDFWIRSVRQKPEASFHLYR